MKASQYKTRVLGLSNANHSKVYKVIQSRKRKIPPPIDGQESSNRKIKTSGLCGRQKTESKKGWKGRKVEGQEEKGKQVTRGKIGGKK